MSTPDAPKKPRPGYTHERIEKLFNTHKLPPEVQKKFRDLKKSFEDLAHHVIDETPSSPHQTIAINKIIEAKDAACLGYITSVMPQEKRVGTPEEIAKDPMYFCPVCKTYFVWATKEHQCCGATWGLPEGVKEPYLLSVDSQEEFHTACGKHGVPSDKQFNLKVMGD